MKEKIVVGMSGGVDSTVSALLLKEQGYEVIGVFMQNWDEYMNGDFLGHKNDHLNQCNVMRDFADVQRVAKQLDIVVHRIDFIDEYWKKVFRYLIVQYKKGLTPNPDILCNKYIKFGKLLEYVKKHFGVKKIAMGHYAQKNVTFKKHFLCTARDFEKDQTYFLCWLTQKQLQKVVFPIGHLLKTEVKAIAKRNHLNVWNKKESTGICFIGERKFDLFLQNYITPKNGKIIDIVANREVGIHNGYMFYTIGQNKNLNLGGYAQKYYVCKKDVKNNVIYVVDQLNKDKFLMSNYCVVKKFNWISKKLKNKTCIDVRFRHRQSLIKGQIFIRMNKVIVKYTSTIGVAKGQFAVVYLDGVCYGGGIVVDIKNK